MRSVASMNLGKSKVHSDGSLGESAMDEGGRDEGGGEEERRVEFIRTQ